MRIDSKITTQYITMIARGTIGNKYDIVVALISMGKGQLEKETMGMSDDNRFMFNWRVDYESQVLFGQYQKQTLYYYTLFALLYG